MIYILYVVYNEIVKEDKLLNNKQKFKVIIFDNSTQENIRNVNKKIVENKEAIYYSLGENVGLAKAYNYVIERIKNKDDYLLILDFDSSLDSKYFDLLVDRTEKSNSYVFTPININKNTNKVDSPKEFGIKKGLLRASEKEYKDEDKDYIVSINNGTLIKRETFEKIGKFDENLFLYFVDSYFYYLLFKNEIKTEVIDYKNYCSFSFFNLNKKQLQSKLKLMKKDAHIYYRNVYSALFGKSKGKMKAKIHYLIFSIMKAKECANSTKKIYFLNYLFTRKGK